MNKLSAEEVVNRLETIPGWEFDPVSNCIKTAYEFQNFKDTITIFTRIAFEAEAFEHHPDFYISYNVMELALTTHDANGVTELDFKLAKRIDELVGFE
ncbi:MAG: 4a-hydroxytetrahydrobiopterin dehydratase [Flavobacteriaceae bacterium]|nr:4a-hydroxytetrahydrobiopterin dehydratase [Flavobacteriaceae bacterium]